PFFESIHCNFPRHLRAICKPLVFWVILREEIPLGRFSKINHLRSLFNKGSHLGCGGKRKWESEYPIFEGSGNQSTLFLREVGVRVPSVKSRRGKWESESPMGNIRYSGRGTHFDCISSNLRARLFDFLTSVIKSISGYRTYLASRTLARFPRR